MKLIVITLLKLLVLFPLLSQDYEPYRKGKRGLYTGFITYDGKIIKTVAYDHMRKPHSSAEHYFKRGFVVVGKARMTSEYVGEYTVGAGENRRTVDHYKQGTSRYFYGVMNSRGKLVIPMKYKELYIAGHTAYCRKKIGGKQKTIPIDPADIPFYNMILLSSFEQGLAQVKKDAKVGMINGLGETIVPFEYDSLGAFSEKDIAHALKNGKWGLITLENSEVIPFEYDEMISTYGHPPYRVKKGSKWGVVSEDGPIVKAEYDSVKVWSSIILAQKDGLFGAFDYQGSPVLPLHFDELSTRKQTFAAKYQSKWGVIGSNNKWILKNEYDDWSYLGYGSGRITKNGKAGIEKEGVIIVPLIYEDIRKVSGTWGWDIVKVIKDGKIKLFNLYKKNWYSSKEFDEIIIDVGKSNFLIARYNGKYGLMGKDGNELTGFVFDEIQRFYRNSKYFPAILKGEKVKLSTDGRILDYKEGLNYSSFSNECGLQLIYPEGGANWHKGVVDKDLRQIVPPLYSDIKVLDCENILVQKRKSKQGIYNKGTLKLNPKYTEIKYDGKYFYTKLDTIRWSSDSSLYWPDWSWQLFQTEPFEELIPFESRYRNMGKVSEGLVAVQSYQHPKYWGYVNLKNELVIDFRFKEAHPFEDGKARVKYSKSEWGSGKYRYIDHLGNFVE